MTTPQTVDRELADWQRLDPRMLLVYPVKELIRFLPVLIGLFLAGTASGNAGDWWHGLGVAIPVSLGVLRYFTTSFRIAAGRVELRRGLVNRHLLSTPLDRVRTVDVTASPIHRVLGLTSVRIGTGTASTDDDDRIDLDGLPVERARQLRTDLLLLGETADDTGTTDTTTAPVEPLVRFDPSWVRFAPLTSSGLVIAAGVLGAAMQGINLAGGLQRFDPERVANDAAGWSVWIAVPLALAGLLVIVTGLSIGGYLVTNWAFELSHTGSARRGAWHLRRGLFTTRETTLDDERVRGVSLGEPIGLRLARGARVSAIVTGLGSKDSGSSILVPPAPRAVVERVAGLVLRTSAPLEAPLTGHGPRARTRRYTRVLWPTLALLLAVVALVVWADLPPWTLGIAALAVPAALLLARDRADALGHGLVERHLVARSGSIDRRREVLQLDGVIGWNLRSTWFQRRAGLTALVATTAGGRQSVTVIDVPEPAALALAQEAHPHLFDQFLL
ncbi:PH domain-containing protein [Nocardioides sp. CN2-186]|uniref:PH domain-containing protein n=1 Tax=Nocardioides tweenelious TaxID=3156607 RepID=UPI0032B42407